MRRCRALLLAWALSAHAADPSWTFPDAPFRATKAPKTEVQNAAAVQQALLAEKTAKTVAQASLLYIHSDGLSQVAKLMDESATAMKEGRMKDAQSLHQKIIGRLKDIKSGVNSGEVVSFSSQEFTPLLMSLSRPMIFWCRLCASFMRPSFIAVADSSMSFATWLSPSLWM